MVQGAEIYQQYLSNNKSTVSGTKGCLIPIKVNQMSVMQAYKSSVNQIDGIKLPNYYKVFEIFPNICIKSLNKKDLQTWYISESSFIQG